MRGQQWENVFIPSAVRPVITAGALLTLTGTLGWLDFSCHCTLSRYHFHIFLSCVPDMLPNVCKPTENFQDEGQTLGEDGGDFGHISHL